MWQLSTKDTQGKTKGQYGYFPADKYVWCSQRKSTLSALLLTFKVLSEQRHVDQHVVSYVPECLHASNLCSDKIYMFPAPSMFTTSQRPNLVV